jgi:hypothetical protein
MQDQTNTVSVYEAAFKSLLKKYGICTGANRLASGSINGIGGGTYECLKADMKRSPKAIKKANSGANFVILLTRRSRKWWIVI